MKFATMRLPISKFWKSCFHNSYRFGAFHWRVNSIHVRFAKIALLLRKSCAMIVERRQIDDIRCSLPFPSHSFSIFFKFSAFQQCCIKKLDSFVSVCVIFEAVRDSILYESLNAWMVEYVRVRVMWSTGERFYEKGKNFSLALCADKITRRDRCKFHSWIDRILRRQIANDLSTVLASLAIGGENFDEVRQCVIGSLNRHVSRNRWIIHWIICIVIRLFFDSRKILFDDWFNEFDFQIFVKAASSISISTFRGIYWFFCASIRLFCEQRRKW